MIICDYGDIHDPVKWDFDESNIPIFIINNYVYKARSIENAKLLASIRRKIDILCDNIDKDRYNWTVNKDNVELFLGIHKEYYYDPDVLPEPFHSISKKNLKTSRYLLSEIPSKTMWAGLNKPKMRFRESSGLLIGTDGDQRPLYRDIFLDLKVPNLDKLVIHELAHTMANHVNYRPDDHKYDFKVCENLIKKYWPSYI